MIQYIQHRPQLGRRFRPPRLHALGVPRHPPGEPRHSEDRQQSLRQGHAFGFHPGVGRGELLGRAAGCARHGEPYQLSTTHEPDQRCPKEGRSAKDRGRGGPDAGAHDFRGSEAYSAPGGADDRSNHCADRRGRRRPYRGIRDCDGRLRDGEVGIPHRARSPDCSGCRRDSNTASGSCRGSSGSGDAGSDCSARRPLPHRPQRR